MANFDTLLSGLHKGLSEGARVTELANDLSPCLEINSKRQFIPKNNFDTVIGYEGDINSQVILFKLLPESFGIYDSHKLSECETKLVKWKNNVSGFEGTSNLIVVDAANSYYKWEVDPSVFTKAGTIEISLTFEDKKDELLAYSWNTSTYLGLSVGKSINTVDYSLPAKDEILIIDKDTKNILAPTGYNNLVCNRGEVGIAHLYFLVNKNLGKGKLLQKENPKTPFKFHIVINGKLIDSYTEGYQLIDYSINDELYLLEWKVPESFTMNHEGTFGLSIEIYKEEENAATLSWRWISNIYTNFKIGQSAFALPIAPPDTPGGGGGGTVVPGLTINDVIKIIDERVPTLLEQEVTETVEQKVSTAIPTAIEEYFTTVEVNWEA